MASSDNYGEIAVAKLQEILADEANRNRPLVLYPFGKFGMMCKGILDVYFGIQDVLIVDNYLSARLPEAIRPLSALNEERYRNALVLITSDAASIFGEIRERLFSVFPREQCIEVFGEVIERDKRQSLEEGEIKRQLFAKMDECHLEENGMVYSPFGIRSKFFLPYVYMEMQQQDIFLSGNYHEIRNLTHVFKEFQGGAVGAAVSGNIILDIGANIGNHTLYFANETGAEQVISFEPIPETFRILRRNVEINHLQDKVTLHCIGLGKRESRAIMPNYYYGNIGGTQIAVQDSGRDGDIKVRALDDMGIRGGRIALMKIDVEGMELSVLEGAAETIKAHRPYIMAESFPQEYGAVEAFMASLGYRVEHLDVANHIFY